MITQLLLYLVAFLAIWFGAGLVISAVEELSHKIGLSSFATSFFVLGILTSIPELSVGLNAVSRGDPEIFVGNFLGASLVIFIFIIPILAIFGDGVKMVHQLTEKNLIFSLLVVITPVFLIADNRVTRTEGVFLVLVYSILVYFIEKKKGLLEKIKDQFLFKKTHF